MTTLAFSPKDAAPAPKNTEKMTLSQAEKMLKGADGQIYAVAQAPLAVTGFASQGKAETVTQGVPTTGRIPNGALIERREIQALFPDK